MNEAVLYAVYGNSGFGREVMPLVAESTRKKANSCRVFIDDNPANTSTNGYDVLTLDEIVAYKGYKKMVIIAASDAKIRQMLSERCLASGLSFMSVESNQHVRMDNCDVGEGAVFSPFTVLTSNIKIGKHFHCNIYSYIAHDCVIGDFVTFAPGVKCNGNVHIEDHAYIGAGAILRQGTSDKPLRIGAGAVVGMGAIVTKDVAAGAVVVGNPARPLEK